MVEEPPPPKAEPKPGVRLSSKEVFEIIAQRKAKAQAKAKARQQVAPQRRSPSPRPGRTPGPDFSKKAKTAGKN